jgi:uncharacterized membrane protein
MVKIVEGKTGFLSVFANSKLGWTEDRTAVMVFISLRNFRS